jgi:ubiquinol-cytochrome c reductase cytochrome c1 subunit
MRPFTVLGPALLAGAVILGAAATARGQEMPEFPSVQWSFSGPFGTFDRASAQRGWQVWDGVCNSCHSMKLVSYRNLAGIGLSEAQIRAIAASKTVPGEPNDQGDPTTRPGLPSDTIASPYPNEKAARAANAGALPPDHSLIEKARYPGAQGADYVRALMLGYTDPPAGVKVPDGAYYNKYFPGHIIHMPPPLTEGAVTYADGTKATVEQEASDVAQFLYFASNPEMEQRKHMGVRMVGFFLGMSALTYAVKRKIWADVH